MKSIHYLLNILLTCSLITFSSCDSYYYYVVNSFGSDPKERTYYIIPEDTTLTDDLEFQEYAGHLKTRLNESGYIETDTLDAALCIVLSYYIGEPLYERTVSYSSSNTLNFSNGKLTSSTNASGNLNAKTTSNNNTISTQAKGNANSQTNVQGKQKSENITFTSTSSQAEYSTQIRCRIKALNAEDMKPIWDVEVSDKIYNNETPNPLRSRMPWMILAIQPYFGKSGEFSITIPEKEGIKRGLQPR